jgi:hypothetical protein
LKSEKIQRGSNNNDEKEDFQSSIAEPTSYGLFFPILQARLLKLRQFPDHLL